MGRWGERRGEVGEVGEVGEGGCRRLCQATVLCTGALRAVCCALHCTALHWAARPSSLFVCSRSFLPRLLHTFLLPHPLGRRQYVWTSRTWRTSNSRRSRWQRWEATDRVLVPVFVCASAAGVGGVCAHVHVHASVLTAWCNAYVVCVWPVCVCDGAVPRRRPRLPEEPGGDPVAAAVYSAAGAAAKALGKEEAWRLALHEPKGPSCRRVWQGPLMHPGEQVRQWGWGGGGVFFPFF